MKKNMLAATMSLLILFGLSPAPSSAQDLQDLETLAVQRAYQEKAQSMMDNEPHAEQILDIFETLDRIDSCHLDFSSMSPLEEMGLWYGAIGGSLFVLSGVYYGQLHFAEKRLLRKSQAGKSFRASTKGLKIVAAGSMLVGGAIVIGGFSLIEAGAAQQADDLRAYSQFKPYHKLSDPERLDLLTLDILSKGPTDIDDLVKDNIDTYLTDENLKNWIANLKRQIHAFATKHGCG